MVDQLLGSLGGLIGLGSQVTDLVSDHGKALAGTAGASGLDSGVQSQNVGLEGDVLDGGNDAADLLRGLGNTAHGLHHFLHVLGALEDQITGLLRLMQGHFAIFGVLLGTVGDLGNGSGQLLHGAGLLGSALCQSLGAGGHLLRTGGHLLGAQVDLSQGVAQVVVDLADGLQNSAQSTHILVGSAAADIEVAVGHLAQQVADVFNNSGERILTAAQRVAHIAQLVLAFVIHGDVQLALAEAHEGLADLLGRLHDALDQLESGAQNQDGSHGQHRDDHADGKQAAALLSVHSLVLRLGQQIVDCLCLGRHIIELGGAAILDQADRGLAVAAVDGVKNAGQLVAPFVDGVNIVLQLGLIQRIDLLQRFDLGIHIGKNLVDTGLQLGIAAVAGFQGHIADVPGGDVGVHTDLREGAVGADLILQDVIVSCSLGIHLQQRCNDDRHRNTDDQQKSSN